MKEFYVYTLADPRNNQIFYVGKGKGNRSVSHLKETLKSNRNSTKYIKIQNILDLELEVIVEKVFQDLEESEAFLLEKILIEKLGRISVKTGVLANIVPGGEWNKESSIFIEKEFDLDNELNNLENNKRLIILEIHKNQTEIQTEYQLDYKMKSVESSRPKGNSLSLQDLIKKKNELFNKGL